jgi:hypothetical protein
MTAAFITLWFIAMCAARTILAIIFLSQRPKDQHPGFPIKPTERKG